MTDMLITKQEAVGLEHLERVDSKDSQHRNVLGEDSKQLSSYWASPRLVGSLAAAVLLANSCYIGYSLPASILNVINTDIGPTPNIYLITLMYSLFMGVLHLFFARISDVVGRRYFLVGGQLFGVLGSIICAKASSINVLISGSALAGIGGAAGLLYPVVIHELIPNKHRHWGQAGVTLSVLPTLGFGAAIARTMAAHTTAGWRGVYWLNVAVSGLSAVLFLVCYFPPNFHMINSKMTKWQEVKALDYGGLFLYFAGLILVIMGFTWAQGVYAWQSAHVLASLIVGSFTLVGFAFYEVYMPLKQPLLPVRLFKIRNITASVFIGSSMQMIWTVSLVFWPIQINALFTTNEVTIGLLSCAPGIALAAGELIFAPIFTTIGHLKWQLIIASAMTAIFAAAMSAVNHERRSMGLGFISLAGLAVGWVELVTIVITGLVAPPHDIGVAQGFLGATRAVFGTVAVSIYIAIYGNRLAVYLPQEIIPAVTNAGLPNSSVTELFSAIQNGTVPALEAVSGMNEDILGVLALATKHAYAHAFKIVYLATLAFTGIGLIASFFITDVKEFLTDYVNKTIHKPKFGRRAGNMNV